MGKLKHKELLRNLDYSPFTGIFTQKINKRGKTKPGDIMGTKDKDGYIIISILGKKHKAHRLAWFYYYGYWPENDLDHFPDRTKDHNWISNLREASKQCNAQNTGNPIHNTSGVKGVCWSNYKNKWIGRMFIKGKNKTLGSYDDFDEAVCARLAGEQCLNWSECDNNSPAYQYVKENIQGKINEPK